MDQIYSLILIFLTVFNIFVLSGNFFIAKLNFYQTNGQPIRTEIDHHIKKQGTTTMGGVIIFIFTLFFTFIFCKVSYIFPIIFLTIGFFAIGLYDDILKVKKQNHKGLSAKKRILLSIIVSILFLYFLTINYPAFISEKLQYSFFKAKLDYNLFDFNNIQTNLIHLFFNGQRKIFSFSLNFGIFFLPILIFIIIGTANSANLTDGLDGLVSIPVVHAILFLLFALGITYFVQFNSINDANYLINDANYFIKEFNLQISNIIKYFFNDAYSENMVPKIKSNLIYLEELAKFFTILCASVCGFLWFNCKPAKIFLGDCGSLMLGAIIASGAIILQVELFLPIVCIVFMIETLSVILQVLYFKATKGKRIFKMAPIHHHFEKSDISEEKIVIRFWLISFCALLLGILIYLVSINS